MFNIFKKMETKSYLTSILAYDFITDPVLTKASNYKELVTEGYKKNIIVFRCVNLIARSIASIPLTVLENGFELSDHPIMKLCSTPNPNNSYTTFASSLISNLLLAGNAYIKPVYSDISSRIPSELYVIRPDKISINTNTNGHLKEYVYSVNNKEIKYKPDEFIHLKFYNPFDELYGMSPLVAGIKSIDQHNSISNHNISILQNGGRPSGCLMIKNQQVPLSSKQREQLEEQIRASYQGNKNSGKIMLLEGDFEWKEMGLSPKDMDFHTGKKMAAREIAEAFAVPPVLVGLEDHESFSNYKEARFHFWEDTIIPLMDYYIGELNTHIIEKSFSNIKLSYDKDKIQALIPRRDALWKQINNSNFLTINEKREALGYPPIENGNMLEHMMNNTDE